MLGLEYLVKCIPIVIVAIIICIPVTMYAIENTDVYKHTDSPEGAYYLSITPIENISGNDIRISLKTDKLNVYGRNNEIIINNDNVSQIVVNGVDNVVYYPLNATPEIIDNGIDNSIIVLEY